VVASSSAVTTSALTNGNGKTTGSTTIYAVGKPTGAGKGNGTGSSSSVSTTTKTTGGGGGGATTGGGNGGTTGGSGAKTTGGGNGGGNSGASSSKSHMVVIFLDSASDVLQAHPPPAHVHSKPQHQPSSVPQRSLSSPCNRGKALTIPPIDSSRNLSNATHTKTRSL
jgi:hypothetical protein